MKRTFVIDEDVFMFAHKCEDAGGNLDVTALGLLLDIIRNCHAIATDASLQRKYSQKMDAVRKGRVLVGFQLLALMSQLGADPSKFKYVEEPGNIECEGQLPEDDRYLVRLAVAAGAVLVTGDSRLRASRAREGRPRHLGKTGG